MAAARRLTEGGDRWSVPVLQARAGGPAERFAARVGTRHPAAVFFAALRKWRIAAFAVFVLVVESATYRVTTLLVPRHRPTVARLEDLPVNASYPSGHTAASIAVYAGLVLLITSRIENRNARIIAWAVAVLIPLFVAFSRMYRGMHHPIDVLGGVLVGIGALCVLLFACRAAAVAMEARSTSRSPALARATRVRSAARRSCRSSSA